MRKILISCIAAVFAFMAAMSGFAGTVSADTADDDWNAISDMAESYAQVLADSSNGLLEYLFYEDMKLKSVAFTDINSDGFIEMLFIADTGTTDLGRALEIRIWTYNEGGTRLAGIIPLMDNTQVAGSQDFIYLMKDGSICHLLSLGDEYMKSATYTYYTFDNSGNLTEVSRDVVTVEPLSYDYPHDYNLFLNGEYNSWSNTDYEYEPEAADRISGFADRCDTMLLNIYYSGGYSDDADYLGMTKEAAAEYLAKLALTGRVNSALADIDDTSWMNDNMSLPDGFGTALLEDGRGPDETDDPENGAASLELKAYRMIVGFYDEMYGAGSIFTDYSDVVAGQENVGLFLDLVDLDRNGADELMIGYINVENIIAMDIWKVYGGKAELSKTLVFPVYGLADDAQIRLSAYSSRTCIITGVPNYMVYVYGYDDEGKFVLLESIDQSGNEYDGDFMCPVVINGEEPLADEIYYICMWTEDLKADVKNVISRSRSRLGY